MEFGAQPHDVMITLKSGKILTFRHPGMKAEPFLRPAFDESLADAAEVFRAKVKEGFEREIRKRG